MTIQTKPLVSVWKAYSLNALDSPRQVNFLSRFMLTDEKAADKTVRKICKKALGRAPAGPELESAKISVARTLSDFNPASKDPLIPAGRKLTNFVAVSCAAVGTAFVALGVSAAQTLTRNFESVLYFGLALAYPVIPAVVATTHSFKNWKKTYRELAGQLERAVRSALIPRH